MLTPDLPTWRQLASLMAEHPGVALAGPAKAEELIRRHVATVRPAARPLLAIGGSSRPPGLETHEWMPLPLDPAEARLRIHFGIVGAPLILGDLCLDPRRQRLEAGGKAIQLTAVELALLWRLARTPNELVDVAALAAELPGWADPAEGARRVQHAMRQLRDTLRAHHLDPAMIAVRSDGYLLASSPRPGI